MDLRWDPCTPDGRPRCHGRRDKGKGDFCRNFRGVDNITGLFVCEQTSEWYCTYHKHQYHDRVNRRISGLAASGGPQSASPSGKREHSPKHDRHTAPPGLAAFIASNFPRRAGSEPSVPRQIPVRKSTRRQSAPELSTAPRTPLSQSPTLHEDTSDRRRPPCKSNLSQVMTPTSSKAASSSVDTSQQRAWRSDRRRSSRTSANSTPETPYRGHTENSSASSGQSTPGLQYSDDSSSSSSPPTPATQQSDEAWASPRPRKGRSKKTQALPEKLPHHDWSWLSLFKCLTIEHVDDSAAAPIRRKLDSAQECQVNGGSGHGQPRASLPQAQKHDKNQTAKTPTGAFRPSNLQNQPLYDSDCNDLDDFTQRRLFEENLRPTMAHQPRSFGGFKHLLPDDLPGDLASKMLAALSKDYSKEEGYIYIYRLREEEEGGEKEERVHDLRNLGSPDSNPSTLPVKSSRRRTSDQLHQSSDTDEPVTVKIGRTIDPEGRLKKWEWKCKRPVQLIELWPARDSPTRASSTSASASPSPSRKKPSKRPAIPFVHQVEALIHIELTELRWKGRCDKCVKKQRHRELYNAKTEYDLMRVHDIIGRWIAWGYQEGEREKALRHASVGSAARPIEISD